MYQNYAVAIRLTLQNQVTNGLIGLSSQFTHLHGSAVALQTQLRQIGMTAIGGGMLLMVGDRMARMFDVPINRAMELQGQIAKLGTLPISAATQDYFVTAAKAEARNTVTSTTASNVAFLREISSAFIDVSKGAMAEAESARQAVSVLPTINKMSALMEVLGKPQQFIGRDLVKLVDLSVRNGQVMTPELFEHHADQIAKAVVSQGGALNINAMLQAAQGAGSGYARWNDKFKYLYFPTLVAETAGSPSQMGTWMNYLDRAGSGRRLMSKHNLKYWMASGLVDGRYVDVNNFTGGVFTDPRGLVDQHLFREDKVAWVTKHAEAIEAGAAKMGLGTGDYLSILFGNSVQADKAMAQIWNSLLTLYREGKFTEANAGMENYDRMIESDPGMMRLAMRSQHNELLVAFGEALMPIAMMLMHNAIPALQSLTKWVDENPAKVKALAIGFAVLASTMAFTGTVMLLNAGFRALAITMGLVRVPGAAMVAGPLTNFLMALRGGAAGAPYLARLGPMLQRVVGVFQFLLRPVGLLLRPLIMFGSALASLNPIALLIAGVIATLTVGFLYFYNNSKEFRGWMLIIGDQLTIWAGQIGTLFAGLGKSIMGFFSQVFEFFGSKGVSDFFSQFTTPAEGVKESAEQMRKRHWESQGWETDEHGKPLRKRSSVVPPSRNGTPLMLQTTVNIDGRRVAETTAPHFARGLSGVQRSTSAPDQSAVLPYPGAPAPAN